MVFQCLYICIYCFPFSPFFFSPIMPLQLPFMPMQGKLQPKYSFDFFNCEPVTILHLTGSQYYQRTSHRLTVLQES